MQIQIHTDHNIDGHKALIAQVAGVVQTSLGRFSEHITHVEVHLSDENSDKKGGRDAMRCMMEARLEGRHSIAVAHQSMTLDQAVEEAADKLVNLIESALERQHDLELRRTDPPLHEPKFT